MNSQAVLAGPLAWATNENATADPPSAWSFDPGVLFPSRIIPATAVGVAVGGTGVAVGGTGVLVGTEVGVAVLGMTVGGLVGCTRTGKPACPVTEIELPSAALISGVSS